MTRKRGRTIAPVHHQTGKTHRIEDKRIHPAALSPGMRVSATGHKYGEYRANRSDRNKRKRL